MRSWLWVITFQWSVGWIPSSLNALWFSIACRTKRFPLNCVNWDGNNMTQGTCLCLPTFDSHHISTAPPIFVKTQDGHHTCSHHNPLQGWESSVRRYDEVWAEHHNCYSLSTEDEKEILTNDCINIRAKERWELRLHFKDTQTNKFQHVLGTRLRFQHWALKQDHRQLPSLLPHKDFALILQENVTNEQMLGPVLTCLSAKSATFKAGASKTSKRE